jgi:competence protein ComEA
MRNEKLPLSARNRRGVLLVIGLSCMIMFTPRVMMVFSEDISYHVSSEEAATFKQKHQQIQKSKQRFRRKHEGKFKRPPKRFDPNTYSRTDWLGLGLSEKQIDVIMRFTDRGVYSNEDLEKIFVLPKELYLLIKDSTVFPARKNGKSKHYPHASSTTTARSIKLLDINKASQEDLEDLHGIGSFYARQILAYREKLGGYSDKKQLMEVWKMREDVYYKLIQKIQLNTSAIRKINLNQATVEELNSHPYLNWNQSNSIVKIRQQKGKFRNIEEIMMSDLIDRELFEKIKIYVTL